MTETKIYFRLNKSKTVTKLTSQYIYYTNKLDSYFRAQAIRLSKVEILNVMVRLVFHNVHKFKIV